VATRRRPAETPVPGELLAFDPAEWAASDQEPWQQGWWSWRNARRSWAAAHPGSLCDSIDRQTTELQTFRDQLKGNRC
jgi:hypothetical protein